MVYYTTPGFKQIIQFLSVDVVIVQAERIEDASMQIKIFFHPVDMAGAKKKEMNQWIADLLLQAQL
jgi:hypothetical protein